MYILLCLPDNQWEQSFSMHIYTIYLYIYVRKATHSVQLLRLPSLPLHICPVIHLHQWSTSPCLLDLTVHAIMLISDVGGFVVINTLIVFVADVIIGNKSWQNQPREDIRALGAAQIYIPQPVTYNHSTFLLVSKSEYFPHSFHFDVLSSTSEKDNLGLSFVVLS